MDSGRKTEVTVASNQGARQELPDVNAALMQMKIEKIKALINQYGGYLSALSNPPVNKFEFYNTYEGHMAAEKMHALNQLMRIIDNHKTPREQRLNAFEDKLKELQPILSTRRDSNSLLFLKGVGTILSFGLLGAYGIWQVRGRNEVNKMHAVLAEKEMGDYVIREIFP